MTTWTITCDRTDAGHGFDHSSLEEARECTAAEAAADRSRSLEERAQAIAFLRETGNFCAVEGCNQPTNH